MFRKWLFYTIRILLGLLFIASALLKANDPMGLVYKMQEFFTAWRLSRLFFMALPLSTILIGLEFITGLGLLLFQYKKLFSLLVALLSLFFTLITAYVFFGDKVHGCGCFGDCITISDKATFYKNIVLLVASLLIYWEDGKLLRFKGKSQQTGSFRGQVYANRFIVLGVIFIAALQFYCLNYLPIWDCLPYREGNNLITEMQVPKGAVPDSFVITFKYRKNGKLVEFDADHFPADFDSSYQYIARYDKLVRKGNAFAPIQDLSLKAADGTDTTYAILSQKSAYVMVVIRDFSNFSSWAQRLRALSVIAKAKKIPVLIVSSRPDEAAVVAGPIGLTVLQCDDTVLKTAARTDPTFLLMQGAVIQRKVSYHGVKELINLINSIP